MRLKYKWKIFFGGVGVYLLCSIVAVHGVQPQRVLIDTVEDFSQGEVDSIVLSEPGQLLPGPDLELLYDFENTLLWDAVRLPSSEDLIVGTGPEGKVFRINQRGKSKELVSFSESDIYAVALSPEGEIFVASSPDGKIFKLNQEGEPEVWFEHGETYVWDMLFDSKGRLYVATGQTGKLFRIDGKNKGSVVFDAEQPHLRSLVQDPKGGLIIGTTGAALVYLYKEGEVPVVLLDALRSDISAVTVTDQGVIYASALGKKRSVGNKVTGGSALGKEVLAGVPGLITVNGAESEAKSKRQDKSSGTKQAISKGKKTNSEVYKIDRDKYPRVVYESADEIHSLAWNSGRLLAGAGEGGRFFEIDDNGENKRLGHIDSKQITTILPDRKGGFTLLGSNWGKVIKLTKKRAKSGRYTSKSIDSGLFADWGQLKVHGEGKWSVRTRSGNTSDPDKSWYPWQFLKDGAPLSPRARYFQFEVKLNRGSIERIDFTYLPQNQPPVIKAVKALKPNLGFISIQQPPTPAKIQTSSQLLQKKASSAPVSTTRYRPVDDIGLRTIVWQASDPNKDTLRYNLKVRREGEEWELLATDLEDSAFSWDTSGWSDGIYYASVEASDYTSNGSGRELSSRQVSEGWRIDHTRPEIRLIQKLSKLVKIRVTDIGGVLESVATSTDGQSYHLCVPKDGILDSENEDFVLDRSSDKPFYIRAKDENGNVSGFHIPAEK